MKDQLIFADTETTGTGPDAKICAVALKPSPHDVLGEEVYFRPEVPIEIGAMAVTHITNDMVRNAPRFEGSAVQEMLKQRLADGGILVAHNAKFDIEKLEAEGVPVPRHICSMKVAQTLDTEGKCEQYKLQYLRYFHGVKVEGFKMAHSALSDVLVLEAFFDQVLAPKFTIEEMLEISAKPVLLNKWPLGKFKGQTFEESYAAAKEVGDNYFAWMLEQDWPSEDLKFTINHWLKQN